MIGYPLCVLLGLCLAALAWWWQPRSTTLPPGQAQTLRLGALAGAILGAYGLRRWPSKRALTSPPVRNVSTSR